MTSRALGFALGVFLLAACGEEAAPFIDAAVDSAVAIDAPDTDAPTADAPDTDAPTADAADTDASTADAPDTDASTADAPDTDASTADAPDTDASTADAPTADAPNIDATPRCGDGNVDPGETCDGNCPTSCADALACTSDVLVGTPGNCDVACLHAGTGCAAGDSCCSPGCDSTTDTDCPFTLSPVFDPNYDVRDLGTASGLPTNYGGLIVSPSDPYTLLIGGSANNVNGAIYRLGLQRDSAGHIVGIVGPATLARQGQYNDGGVVFAPNGALILARYPVNELGMQRAGSTINDKIVALSTVSVASSVGGLALVPAGHPGAGSWKLVSWSGGQWYELTLVPDATGTYDVTAAALRLTLAGGPEGIVYVPLGSPLFANPGVLVSEYSAGKVSTYEVDAAGDPVLASRRELITNLTGAEGAAIDPVSGDFLFSTYGGGNRILVVRGFNN